MRNVVTVYNPVLGKYAPKISFIYLDQFLPLEQILEVNMDTLFQGCNIRACHAFRVCRNADVERNEEEAEDLAAAAAGRVKLG